MPGMNAKKISKVRNALLGAETGMFYTPASHGRQSTAHVQQKDDIGTMDEEDERKRLNISDGTSFDFSRNIDERRADDFMMFE